MIYETTLMGRLGRDAELSHVDNGSQAVKFSVCHTKTFAKNDGSKGEEITWLECTKWYKGTETPTVWQFLKKGDPILLKGTVGAKAYMDKTGEPAFFLTFKISEIHLIPTRQ